MIRQINPRTHPWLQRIACLHRPYVAARHSVFTCPLSYRECKPCRLEACRYFVPDDDEFDAMSPEDKKSVLTRWFTHLNAGHKTGSPESLAAMKAEQKAANREVARLFFERTDHLGLAKQIELAREIFSDDSSQGGKDERAAH
jgi:hypothetical protein